MTYKSNEQPFCRWCGKAIPKRTTYVAVNDPTSTARPADSEFWRHIYPEQRPTSKDECQKLTNEKVVSVHYDYAEQNWIGEYPNRKLVESGARKVRDFRTWDGESYIDEFFCNGQHANWFGYAAAAKGLAMPKYNEAVRKKREAA